MQEKVKRSLVAGLVLGAMSLIVLNGAGSSSVKHFSDTDIAHGKSLIAQNTRVVYTPFGRIEPTGGYQRPGGPGGSSRKDLAPMKQPATVYAAETIGDKIFN